MKITKILKVYYSNYIFNLIIKNTSAYGLDALLFLFIDANGKKNAICPSFCTFLLQAITICFIYFIYTTKPKTKYKNCNFKLNTKTKIFRFVWSCIAYYVYFAKNFLRLLRSS